MENPAPQSPIRLELTPEQKQKLKLLTGAEADALEFTAQELETRIAPRLASN